MAARSIQRFLGSLDYNKIRNEIVAEKKLVDSTRRTRDELLAQAQARNPNLTQQQKTAINNDAKRTTKGNLTMAMMSPYLKEEINKFYSEHGQQLQCSQGLDCYFRLLTDPRFVNERNYVKLLQFTESKFSDLFPPEWTETTASVLGPYFKIVKTAFSTKKKWDPPPPHQNWLDWQAHLTPSAVVEESRRRGQKRSRDVLTQPMTIREDQILSLAKWLKTDLLDQRLRADNTPKNTLLPNIDLIHSSQTKLSEEGCKLALLLQLSIGSRWKGILVTNTITEIPDNVPRAAPHGIDEMKLDETQQNAVKSYLRLETKYRNDLVLVEGLSKQRSDVSNEERRDRDNDYVAPDLKAIVKPTIYMFLPRKTFMKLFKQLRRAVWTILQKNVPDSDLATFSLSTAELQTSPNVIQLVNASNAMANELLLQARNQLRLPKPNNEGTHLLRKLYAMYSYRLFASHACKDVSWVMEVLGHRDLGTSLMYTDVLIERPTALAGQLSLDEALITKLSDLIAEVKQLREEVFDAQGGFSIERLPTVRFTDAEKQQGRDVSRIIDAMSQWPQDVPLTISNMRRLGIGNNLIFKVRNSNEFQNLKNGRENEEDDE